MKQGSKIDRVVKYEDGALHFAYPDRTAGCSFINPDPPDAEAWEDEWVIVGEDADDPDTLPEEITTCSDCSLIFVAGGGLS